MPSLRVPAGLAGAIVVFCTSLSGDPLKEPKRDTPPPPVRRAATRVVVRPQAAVTPPLTGRIDELLKQAEALSSPQIRRSGEAVALYRQALALARERNDAARIARAQAGLGSALLSVHQQNESRQTLHAARLTARQAGLPAVEAEAVIRLFILEFERGDIDAAEAAVRDAQAIGERHKLLDVQLRALNMRTAMLRRVGRIAEAKETGQETLRRLDGSKGVAGITRTLWFQVPYNYGRALIDHGDFSRGFALLDRAYDAAAADRSLAGRWHVLHDTAEWYREQNDLERAARYYERALENARAIESRDPEATTRLGLARLSRQRGALPEAERHCRAAIEMLTQAGLRHLLPEAFLELGRIEAAAQRYGAAEASMTRSKTIAEEDGTPLGVALASVELAAVLRRSGQLDRAAALAVNAVTMARTLGLRSTLPAALNELGAVALARNAIDDADRWYTQSVNALESMRTHVVSPLQRIAFAESAHEAHEGLLTVRLRRFTAKPSAANAASALSVVERERAFSSPHASAPPEAMQQLDARIAQLQWQLTVPGLGPQRASLLRALDDAERRREALDAERVKSASASQREKPIAELQRSLHDGEALLLYAASTRSAVVFAVTREQIHLFPIAAHGSLPSRAAFFMTLVAEGRGAEALAAGSRLSRELLAPTLQRLPASTSRIYIGATGALASLPFAALPYPAGSGKPLLQSYELAYVPSLTALHEARAGARPVVNRLLAFANPAVRRRMSHVDAGSGMNLGELPESAREVRDISRHTASEDVVSGADASETLLKSRRLGDYGVLHFATHALVDPISPQRSAVVLARGSDENDGLLQPREIEQIPLGGQLVVLSGCRTATGRASNVEGSLSLTRSFLIAGARAVVGTLADVEDKASARLIRTFYARLALGDSVATALRGAQLEEAGRLPYESIAVWGPWIVAGDGTMSIPVDTGGKWIWLVLGSISAVFLAVWYWKATGEVAAERSRSQEPAEVQV